MYLLKIIWTSFEKVAGYSSQENLKNEGIYTYPKKLFEIEIYQ